MAKDEDGLSQFLAGTYEVVGRLPDSEQVYSGTLQLKLAERRGFTFTKKVANLTITGKAKIEKALAGEAKVLRMHFEQDAQAYESTCLISSDLDNYARLTCQTYLQNGSTKRAGQEALFMQQDASSN